MFTPQRLDRALSQLPDSAATASFLERPESDQSSRDETRRRAALGAYLVARLIERVVEQRDGAEPPDGLHWQRDSTLHYLQDLPTGDAESAHLGRIVRAVEPRPRQRLTGIRIALHDYAAWLEHEGRLREALETLRLTASTWLGAIPPAEFAALALFAGRINRELHRWDYADESFAAALEAAADCGDQAAHLRARLGAAGVMRARGDLCRARQEVEWVIAAAEGHGHLRAVLGLAYADLGAVLARSGRPVEAVRALYDAYHRMPDPIQRLRIMGELGVGLAELGANDAARLAFGLVTESRIGVLVRAAAAMELMDLASAERDRVGFERHRAAVRELAPRMPAEVAVDFGFRTALGFARFGQFARSREIWCETRALASANGLHEWHRTIEHVLRGLDGCRANGITRPAPAQPSPEVVALADALRSLATAAGA